MLGILMRMARRFFLLGLLVLPFSIPFFAQAGTLTFISDLISTSAPGVRATHTIQFTVANAIPSSGVIFIKPDGDAFIIPASFDYTDMQFSIATSGPYVGRTLAASASATNDGVAIVS